MEYILIGFVLWCICGYFAYGWAFAYFQGKYPQQAKDMYWEDRGVATFMAILGPFGFLVSFMSSGFGKKYGRLYK